MEYKIEYDTIKDIIEEEVSREARQAVGADGASLYDKLRLTSRDENAKKRLLLEVLVIIREHCSRFISCSLLDAEKPALLFSLEGSTRRVNGREESIQALLESITVNSVLNKHLISKNEVELAAKYGGMAVENINMLKTMLFTKTPPAARF